MCAHRRQITAYPVGPGVGQPVPHVWLLPESHEVPVREPPFLRILRQDICTGLRGAYIRVEQRRDGSVAAYFNGRYLRVERCELRPKVAPPKPAQTSTWNQDFNLKKG